MGTKEEGITGIIDLCDITYGSRINDITINLAYYLGVILVYNPDRQELGVSEVLMLMSRLL